MWAKKGWGLAPTHGFMVLCDPAWGRMPVHWGLSPYIAGKWFLNHILMIFWDL